MSLLPDYGAHGGFILVSWGASVLVLAGLIARAVLRARSAERRLASMKREAGS